MHSFIGKRSRKTWNEGIRKSIINKGPEKKCLQPRTDVSEVTTLRGVREPINRNTKRLATAGSHYLH